ncbi:MAG: alpha/beta hydrolase, partial [Planctomycetota bacterium]|nr:alpha/beta hydrolase [Planctomycetota bacterium]
MRKRTIALFVAALLTFTAASLLFTRPEPTLRQDVVFGTGGGEQLCLDLAMPGRSGGPFPLIVCLHGGAWISGNKSSYRETILDFARRGYVAASVQYRLAPRHKFPAQIEDAKCAVRYLRAHAAEFRINPNRVGALGDSAGGHLALLLGLMNPQDGLEGGGGCAEQASKVQAIVNYYGPTDLAANDDWAEASRAAAAKLLGTTDPNDPIVARASPVTYIDSAD